MDDVWRAVASEIAWAFVGPIVAAVASTLVGWLVYWWQQLFRSSFDERARNTIHAALERGMLHAIQTLRERQGHALVTETTRRQLLSDAAAYTERWSGGTVSSKKLSHADLMELAVPHLPLPAGIVMPATSLNSGTSTPK